MSHTHRHFKREGEIRDVRPYEVEEWPEVFGAYDADPDFDLFMVATTLVSEGDFCTVRDGIRGWIETWRRRREAYRYQAG